MRLTRRSVRRARPCMDDEIPLLRLHALLGSDANLSNKPAITYALAESGLYPSETTAVCMNDFDDPHAGGRHRSQERCEEPAPAHL